jgi:hypothetical protein
MRYQKGIDYHIPDHPFKIHTVMRKKSEPFSNEERFGFFVLVCGSRI